MFDLPDHANASFDAQARLFSNDLKAITQTASLTGVKSGCGVTAQGSPNMTVAVASGVCYFLNAEVVVSAGNETITTAHATWPRIDIVVVNSSGTKSVVAGTAAEFPLEPSTPASSIMLAQVYVPANDTAIGATQIRDRGITLQIPSVAGALNVVRKTATETLASNITTLQNDDQLKFPMTSNNRYRFKLCVTGTQTPVGGSAAFDWAMPAGAVVAWGAGVTSASQTTMGISLPATGRGFGVFEGIVTTAVTSGDMQLRWAAGASTSGNTISILANSYIEWGALA